MLTEKRYEKIMELLEEKDSITIVEICDELDVSESTARRDITALAKAGKLTKVFGGAIALEHTVIASEPTVAQKIKVNEPEKRAIAKKAAEFVEKDDFIYLDAGTTTGYMIDYLDKDSVIVFTNSISHVKILSDRGFKVILCGGEVKSSTEAIVGSQAMKMVENFHFTKGFFGANGVEKKAGFTTPDSSEALIKELAISHCKDVYVLADRDKFDKISSVTFAGISAATIITDEAKASYKNLKNVMAVGTGKSA